MANKEANVVIRLRDRASSGFQKVGKSVKKLLKPIGLVTGALTFLGTILGGLFLKSAIQNTGTFGEQLSILQGLTQGTAEEMAALEEAARTAGASTRFSATEAGQGLEELARGGQSARDSIDTLNPVLQLAAGNNQSVAESAQQVITTLNQFNLATDQSARVSDVFTRAAQKSAQTTQQLARTLQQAGPVAAQANLSIEETAALAGRLADAGFRGERGGTALRNALSQLSDPASKFSKELKALGINSTNFVEVLAELQGKGDAANKAIRALGLEASPAIQALVSGGSEALQGLVAELNNAGGAATEAARAMEDNLPGAFRNLKSAFSELQIALTQPLTEEIKEGVFDLADTIRNFAASDTLGTLRDLLVETFQAGRQAITEFVNGIDLESVTAQFRDFVDDLRSRVGNFKQQAFNLQATFTQIIGGANVLIGGLRAAYNALGVIIGGVVTAATEGTRLILKAFDYATLGLNKWVGAVDQELKDLSRSFQETTAGFANGWVDAAEQIGQGYQQLATTAKKATDEIVLSQEDLNYSLQETKTTTDVVREAMLSAWEAAKKYAKGAREAGEASGEAAEGMGAAGDAAEESARSVEDLRDQAEQAATPFDKLKTSIQNASSITELNQLVRQMETLQEQGKITDEEFARLRDTVLQKSQAMRDAAAAGDENTQSMKRGADAANENAEAQKKAGEEAEESEGRMVRLGGSVKLAAAAQEELNRQLQQWQGGGTASFINLFKRSLEGALAVQKEVDSAQARLNRLTSQGIDITTDFAAANRELRYEYLELTGQTEKLADARKRERDEALRAQLALAQAQGDEDRVREIRKNIELQRRLTEERERQARQEERERQKRDQDSDRDRETAESLERASRGGTIRQDIRVVIESAAGRDGAPEWSQADLDRLADRIMQKIDFDGART